MDRQNDTVELFETFEVEQIASQVRMGHGDYYGCEFCYYLIKS